jgi:hypothetical protein
VVGKTSSLKKKQRFKYQIEKGYEMKQDCTSLFLKLCGFFVVVFILIHHIAKYISSVELYLYIN